MSGTDSRHYLYRVSQLNGPPIATFTGHRTDSYAVRACFSPCGDFLLSGSSDSKPHIWQVRAVWC